MNTIRSIVSIQSYRIPPRLKLVSTRLGSLILLFQRMPVVQFLFPEANIIGGASVANTISLAVTTVVGLGLFDSVAGQSQISQTTPLVVFGKEPATATATSATAINVPAKVSAFLTFGFNWDPNNDYSKVKSWRCTTGDLIGTLPAGLGPAFDSNSTDTNGVTVGVGTTIPITGTLTATPGIYPVTVKVYKSINYQEEVAAQIFNICVLGFSAQPTATPASISSGQSSNLTCTVAGNPAAIPIVGSGPPAAQPAGTLTYQWYRGTKPDTSNPVGTPNSPSPAFTTPTTLTATTDYWVQIKSVLGTSTLTVDSNTVTVTVTAASSPYDTWASGLETLNGPMDIPQGDGVTNLEKFAFNLEPTLPDVRRLTVGAGGTAGLPGATLAAGKLRMEFLRRKFVSATNPGITYTPQFCSNLGTWENFTGSPVSVTDVLPGTDWERVVVDDPNSTADTKRFGRVKVIKTP